MKNILDKYHVKEDEKTTNYHRSRRMFCIKDKKLHIAESGVTYSHAEWFIKENWITEQDDTNMDIMTRGYVDTPGNVYFYVGFDFRLTLEAVQEMKVYLPELIDTLHLNDNAKIFGGWIRDDKGNFQPLKLFGTLREFLVSDDM